MSTHIAAKLAAGAVTAALLFGAGSLAFAQTTNSSGVTTSSVAYPGVGSVIPTSSGASASGNTSTNASGSVTTSPSSAQTVPSTPVSGSASSNTTTPGIPNTGAGGMADANMLVLGTTGLIAVLGGAYLARQRYAR